MADVAPAIERWRVRHSSAVLILIALVPRAIVLLIGATAATLLGRTNLFRLAGLIAPPAFLALLTGL